MATRKSDRARPALTPVCTVLLGACLCAPGLAGCVDILGDYQISTGSTTGSGGGSTGSGGGSTGSGGGTPACAESSLWAKSYGDGESQLMGAVALDACDDVVVVGAFTGSLDLGGGKPLSAPSAENDAFVIKLDAGGNPLWSRRFGGLGSDQGNGVAVDPDGNVFVVGHIEGEADFSPVHLTSAGGSDIFVAKLSPNGDVLWAERFGDVNEQEAIAVASDASGNALVTGCIQGSTDFGGGKRTSLASLDAFVVKLDPEGGYVWDKVAPGAGLDCGYRIAADGDDVLVTGIFTSTLDFGDPLLSAGGLDIFVAKLAPDGAHEWSVRIGDQVGSIAPANQIAGGISAGPGGHVVVTGAYGGTLPFVPPFTALTPLDPFVAVFSSTGQSEWSRGLTTDGEQVIIGSAIDSSGSIFLAGQSVVAPPAGSPAVPNVYLAKVDVYGNLVWQNTWSTADAQRATGIAVDSTGNVVVAGDFAGQLGIGGALLDSAGLSDLFMTRLPGDAAPR
jgi:hypothetical protein